MPNNNLTKHIPPPKNIISIRAEKIYVFESFMDWVNNASRKIGGLSRQHTIICIDKKGYYCFMGQQFMYARDNDLFPVTAYRLIKNTE